MGIFIFLESWKVSGIVFNNNGFPYNKETLSNHKICLVYHSAKPFLGSAQRASFVA